MDPQPLRARDTAQSTGAVALADAPTHIDNSEASSSRMSPAGNHAAQRLYSSPPAPATTLTPGVASSSYRNMSLASEPNMSVDPSIGMSQPATTTGDRASMSSNQSTMPPETGMSSAPAAPLNY